MNKMRKTLGQLFASQVDEEEDKGKSSKESNKEVKDKKDDDQESDDETEDDDDQEENSDKKKKKKSEESDTKEASEEGQTGMVTLALEDYERLVALASTAKSASEENKKLKAKADQWDSYQAALSGTKPDADTKGAKSEKAESESNDPYAGLRSKYGSLMEDC